ncbi:MAG: ABC transporter ATP-binding protein, partial [Kiritimatiellae bacterium]|nr:ABC transporter ATP-binding protein [Kiritimatiellia bacterium]
SFAERREFEQLGRELEELGAERARLEALLSGGTADYAALAAASERYGALKEELDAKELRWLELSELA